MQHLPPEKYLMSLTDTAGSSAARSINAYLKGTGFHGQAGLFSCRHWCRPANWQQHWCHRKGLCTADNPGHRLMHAACSNRRGQRHLQCVVLEPCSLSEAWRGRQAPPLARMDLLTSKVCRRNCHRHMACMREPLHASPHTLYFYAWCNGYSWT